MHKLSFYRQKRQDDGIRTAVTIDDDTVLHHFEPGQGPSDPALLWYVDLRCEGARLPTDPEKAMHWLREQTPVIRNSLTALAEKLKAGVDVDAWPINWPVSPVPRGTRMMIVCSAIRRVTLLDIASVFREVRDHWEEILEQLSPFDPARH